MKTMLRGALLCLGVLSASAQAQMIYKCVVHGAITYQGEPCEVIAATKGVSSNTILIGKWSYDHDGTMAWMKHHGSMAKELQAALDGLAGHFTYTFTPTLASVDRAAFDVVVDGKVQQHRKALQASTPYNVVSANSKLVTASVQDPDTYSGIVAEYHFEGADTMWISLANQRLTSVDNPNLRMYFKRVH